MKFAMNPSWEKVDKLCDREIYTHTQLVTQADDELLRSTSL
jgi:hypothetical protein